MLIIMRCRTMALSFLMASLSLLIASQNANAVYSRTYESVAINSCNSAMLQDDQITDIGHGRSVLVSSWLPSHISFANSQRVKDLAKWADRTMVSFNPLSSSDEGLMSRGYAPDEHTSSGYKDYIVITQNALYWFDFSAASYLGDPNPVLPNGGGGQLRGVWPLKLETGNDLNLLNFRNIRNANNWAPNQLLPGANGNNLQGSGVSGFITEHQADNGKTFNIENDENAYMTYYQPLSTGIAGGSGTLRNEGFFVQSVGKFVDTEPGGDRYSIGSSSTTGHVRSTTSYRIAGCDDKIFIESSWTSESLIKIGPIANVLSAINTYGEKVLDVYGNNIVAFDDTGPQTCITRNTYEDTECCHIGAEDFRALNKEHVYRSRPSFDVAPPTMTMLSGASIVDSTNPSLGHYSLSGVSSVAIVFDTHSLTKPTLLVPAFDLTYFNRSFYKSQSPVDHRYEAPDNSLPYGLESDGINYFLSPLQNMTMRYVLELR